MSITKEFDSLIDKLNFIINKIGSFNKVKLYYKNLYAYLIDDYNKYLNKYKTLIKKNLYTKKKYNKINKKYFNLLIIKKINSDIKKTIGLYYADIKTVENDIKIYLNKNPLCCDMPWICGHIKDSSQNQEKAMRPNKIDLDSVLMAQEVPTNQIASLDTD